MKTLLSKFFSITAFFAMVTVMSCCQTISAQPPVSGYELAWFDEFDGTELDDSKWIKIFSLSPTNNSLHAYLPEQVTVSGGNMVITSTDVPFNQFDYRSGQVFSTSRQKYGRWEVSAQLPTSRGMWPAIWLLPDENLYLWPSGGEIDIMENRGNQPDLTSSAFHYGTNPPFVHNFVYDEQQTSRFENLVDFHAGFHEYAVEWDEDQIRFFIDDVHYYTVFGEDVGNFVSENTQEMALLINTAIGGTFLPNPDNTSQFPQELLIDYAYVYEPSGSVVETFENGDFEAETLADWTVFGRILQFPNVSVQRPQFALGNASLKLFGQFDGQDNYSGIEQGIRVIAAGDTLRATCKTYIPSNDSIAGTNNQVNLKIDYYTKPWGRFASADYISSDQIVISNSNTPNNQWLEHELISQAPAGAQSARVAVVFNQPDGQSGATFVDDIEFENVSLEPVNLEVDSLIVLRGINVSGDQLSLNMSDDVRLEYNPGFTLNSTESPVWLQVTAAAPSFAPSSIEFSVESRANTVNISQTIQILNYVTGNLETVDVRNTGFNNDSVTTVSLTGDLNEYRSPANGTMTSLLSWNENGFILLFPWRIGIDQVGWTITP